MIRIPSGAMPELVVNDPLFQYSIVLGVRSYYTDIDGERRACALLSDHYGVYTLDLPASRLSIKGDR